MEALVSDFIVANILDKAGQSVQYQLKHEIELNKNDNINISES